MFFDYSGRYEREAPIRALTGFKYRPKVLLALERTFIISSADLPITKGDPDYVTIHHKILALDGVTLESRDLSSFPTISYMYTSGDGHERGFYEMSTFSRPRLKTDILPSATQANT